jgi:4-hydroxybenzoate polyprenyltransferase
LNDAFDAQFDMQRRPERPIPSGAISVAVVWQAGLAWLAAGLICLMVLGYTTALLALLLAGCIFIYDAIHKMFAFSPFLMAVCRFLLVVVAASTGYEGVTGLTLWSALVLASYIVGLSYLARKESTHGSLRYWPCLFLAAPLVLALVVNQGDYKWRGMFFAGALGIWILRCLRFTYWSPQRNVGLSVAGLLAGIVLVDLLAVAGSTLTLALIFTGLFVLALAFQRFVPAT